MSEDVPEIETAVEEQEKEVVAPTVREPTVALKIFTEFVGTLGLAYTVTMTAAVAKGESSNIALDPVAVPICASGYLVLMVYAIGNVSGCHINPAVSTAVYFWQFLSGTSPSYLTDWTSYVLAQLVGGICGGLLGAMFWETSEQYQEFVPFEIFPFVPDTRIAGMAMITEMLAVFFFTFSILRNCCDHDKPSLSTDGLAIGISLFAAIMGTVQISGGCVNPAVATALRVANDTIGFSGGKVHRGEETFVIVYWAGPLMGALLAAIAHYIIESRTNKQLAAFGFLHTGRPENRVNTATNEETTEQNE